jgi:hypothetical protein
MKITKALAVIAGIASLAAFPTANAQDVTCQNANFSEAVLESFGSIRYSCLEIVQRNGEPHAYIRAEVVRVWPPKLTVRAERTDGTESNEITFTPADGYEFMVDQDRRKSTLAELTESSVLHVYVPVEAPIGKLGFVIDPQSGEVIYFELDE